MLGFLIIIIIWEKKNGLNDDDDETLNPAFALVKIKYKNNQGKNVCKAEN